MWAIFKLGYKNLTINCKSYTRSQIWLAISEVGQGRILLGCQTICDLFWKLHGSFFIFIFLVGGGWLAAAAGAIW